MSLWGMFQIKTEPELDEQSLGLLSLFHLGQESPFMLFASLCKPVANGMNNYLKNNHVQYSNDCRFPIAF